MIIETHDPEETFEVGRKIGMNAKPGQIYTLTGDLGVGKTVFTQGVAAGLGITEPVNSPTFTIIQEYEDGRLPFYHFDVYRLSDSSEFYEIGGEEYFDNGICLIEWGELIKDALPKDFIHIKFEKNNEKENYRTLNIDTYGTRFNCYFSELKPNN